MNKFITLISFLAFGLIAVNTSYASYGSEACQPIYGGGQTCATTNRFVLDKKVLNPQATKGNVQAYVDNLSVNDPKYSPTQKVKFQLVATNTGDSTLSNLTLTDTIPDYVDFVSGPGKFDKDTRTLTYNISSLNPNESKKYTVEVKVKSTESLPSSQGVVCVVNQASLKLEDNESKDNSQFCIQKTLTKGGLPVMPAPNMTQTPATGPEMLPLLGLIPAALGGLFLRKRSK